MKADFDFIRYIYSYLYISCFCLVLFFKLEVKLNLPANLFHKFEKKTLQGKRGVLWVGVLWFSGLVMAGAYPQPCTKIMRKSSPPPKINVVVLKVGMAVRQLRTTLKLGEGSVMAHQGSVYSLIKQF